MSFTAAAVLAVLAAAPAPVVADDEEVERRTYQSEKTIVDPAPAPIVREREYVEPGAATIARERRTSETVKSDDDDDDGDTKVETKIEHDD
jgi:hypothetical protein